MILTTVTTPRLHLREFVVDDAESLVGVEGSESMVQYQAHQPLTISAATEYVTGAISAQSEDPRTWIELAICLPEVGLIGRVGASIEERHAWIWYVIAQEQQGRGYATEAVGAFLKTLHSEGVSTVSIECDPRNVPSWRLAERLGFNFVKETADAVEIKGAWCGSKVYTKVLVFSDELT